MASPLLTPVEASNTNILDYDLSNTLDEVPNPSTQATKISEHDTTTKHLYVLPVILLEFLALALTRAVLPSMLLDYFGDGIYLVMGIVDFVRGMLAFVACPLFGKISDVVGRKACLFVTVLGTCSPVCIIALLPYSDNTSYSPMSVEGTSSEPSVIPEGEDWTTSLEGSVESSSPPRIMIFVCLLALSGIFSSTFTLTFAYISDVVKDRHQRVSAFGLALATFGLSFTIGPIAGGYIARSEGVSDEMGKQRVFTVAFILTILDLLYIYFILPESIPPNAKDIEPAKKNWNPMDTIKIFHGNALLIRVSHIAFLYYTSLWAVISTMVLYATKRFHLAPDRLGELISAFGFSTMLAEAVVVRFVVPIVGEKKSMKMGLIAFMLQCIVLAFAYEPWHLFLCVALSTIGNLVYPSLTSLVSASVPPQTLGEVLGAINGIKALTEGVGPLFFGTLMTISENTLLPGWPYLVAAVFSFLAYQMSHLLPEEGDESYEMDKLVEMGRKGEETCGLLDDEDDNDI